MAMLAGDIRKLVEAFTARRPVEVVVAEHEARTVRQGSKRFFQSNIVAGVR